MTETAEKYTEQRPHTLEEIKSYCEIAESVRFGVQSEKLRLLRESVRIIKQLQAELGMVKMGFEQCTV